MKCYHCDQCYWGAGQTDWIARQGCHTCFKGLQWQTLVRGDIGRQGLFRPLANPGEVEASCVFRAPMGHEVKQHDFKIFENDS
jgi:hypothetical protein